MHSKCDNIEIMMNGKADEIIEDLFDSLKNRYQNLEFRICFQLCSDIVL